MAKKPQRGERSKAVREYLKENPKASPQTIVAELKEKGIKVSLGLASVVKYTSRPGSIKLSGDPSVENLLRAKRFVDAVGGVEAAKEAIKTIEMLQK